MIEPSHELKPVWQRLAHYGVLTFAGLIFAGSMIASGPAGPTIFIGPSTIFPFSDFRLRGLP